jgi:hypothetical protein
MSKASKYNNGKADKTQETVTLQQKLQNALRIEAGEPQVGVSMVLGLSGPSSKCL